MKLKLLSLFLLSRNALFARPGEQIVVRTTLKAAPDAGSL